MNFIWIVWSTLYVYLWIWAGFGWLEIMKKKVWTHYGQIIGVSFHFFGCKKRFYIWFCLRNIKKRSSNRAKFTINCLLLYWRHLPARLPCNDSIVWNKQDPMLIDVAFFYRPYVLNQRPYIYQILEFFPWNTDIFKFFVILFGKFSRSYVYCFWQLFHISTTMVSISTV